MIKSIAQFFLLIWLKAKYNVELFIEKAMFSQKWIRKAYGGTWKLVNCDGDIHWSNTPSFVDDMAYLNANVDVLKTETYS